MNNSFLQLKKAKQDKKIRNLDSLSLKKDKKVLKILRKNEKIILSTKIQKFNHKSKRQMRNFLITTTFVYNLNPYNTTVNILSIFNKEFMIKRKIPIHLITAISVSTLN